jgi:hypothetical protein
MDMTWWEHTTTVEAQNARHWDDVCHMPTDDESDHDYNDEGSEDE